MKILLTIAILGLASLAGCDRAGDNASITADELLIAQGGRVFTVIIPAEVNPNSFAGLALRSANGSISLFGSTNGLKPSEVIKIVIFEPKEGSLRYAILGDGHTHRGEATNFPAFGMQVSNGRSDGLNVDEPLMRFAAGNTVSSPPAKVSDGELDLIYHIQNANKP